MNEKPIRVLHVVSCMNCGGAETMIMNLYRNIDRSILQFDFIVHNEEKGYYDEEIIKLGGRIIRCKSLGTIGVFKYINQISNIIIKKGPFNAVHAHTDIQSGVVALAAKIAGVKIRVTHSHSTELQHKSNYKFKIYYKILSVIIKLFSNNYCACSTKAGEFLYGKKNIENLIVLNNGIDVDKFLELDVNKIKKLKKDFLIEDSCIVLGHIGRFIEVKNHKFIIRIAKKLKEMKIKYKFILVGDGVLLNDILEEIKKEKLDEEFIFLGLRKDVHDILKIIDIFIMPSLYEGIPVALIEAQASNVTCIISDKIDGESDMGLNLTHRVSLESGELNWCNNIIRLSKSKSDKLNIKKQLKLKGYDVIDNINKIYKLYGIR